MRLRNQQQICLFVCKQLDIAIANHIKLIVQLIKYDRETADIPFKSIFDEATNISLQLGVENGLPRIVARQIFRTNQPATTVCEYFLDFNLYSVVGLFNNGF